MLKETVFEFKNQEHFTRKLLQQSKVKD